MADWAVVAAGVALILVSLVDAYGTLFHYDVDGPVGRRMRRVLWIALMRVAGSRGRRRRRLLGLSGPLLVAATFLLWFGTYILGFALLVWPFQTTGFTADPELTLGTFANALYYSGVTATVLGFGDVTPTGTTWKMLSVVEAGLGFLLFTATVTYAVTLLSGASQRHALGNRVRQMAGGQFDGVNLVLRLLPSGAAQAASRIADLTRELGTLQEKLHHFPILDLYYRSTAPQRDPEPMLAALADAALALYVAAEVEPVLGTAAEELDGTLSEVMSMVARANLGRAERAAYREAQADVRDERRLGEIRRRLRDARTSGAWSDEEPPSEAALALAARTRVFLDTLDGHTRWRVDHADRPHTR